MSMFGTASERDLHIGEENVRVMHICDCEVRGGGFLALVMFDDDIVTAMDKSGKLYATRFAMILNENTTRYSSLKSNPDEGYAIVGWDAPDFVDKVAPDPEGEKPDTNKIPICPVPVENVITFITRLAGKVEGYFSRPNAGTIMRWSDVAKAEHRYTD